MSKLKKIRDYLEKKLNEIVVEDVEDKRPPKDWWDDCYSTIQKKNPKYNDEQIRKTCGKIYYKMNVHEKIGDFMDDVDKIFNDISEWKGMKEVAVRKDKPEEEREEEEEGLKPPKKLLKQALKGMMKDTLPSETVKEPGSFREYCGGEVDDACIKRGLNSDDESIQAKAKLAKAFKTMRGQKKAKKKKDLANDNITTDFQVINDTTLGGYVVRDGPYQYGVDEHGNPLVKYKTWDNLQEAYGNLKKVIGYGSRYNDSHYESDDRMIGFWDTFTLVPKGKKGPTKPYVDERYNRVWAKLNTSKDIIELSDLDLEDLKHLPVSGSYDDLGDGIYQKVGKIHHIATSLNRTERDRCSTMGGSPCNVSVLDTIHDQNIKGVQIPTHDFDSYNGVLRADLSQPPTNKIKKDGAIMTNDKEKEEPTNDTQEEQEEQEEDMKTTKEGQAPEYEAEDKKKLLEEDENEMKPKKKKGDMEDSALAEVISANNDLRAENEVLKAKIQDMLPIIDRMKEEYQSKDAKDFEDLQETLSQEPYNVPKETIKEKDLLWLKEKKDFLDSLPMIQDFYKDQPLTHENVNKHVFDLEVPPDPLGDILAKAQRSFKIATDFGESDKK